MKKQALINLILRLDPQSAYYCTGEFIGNKEYRTAWGDWTRPYAQYVNNESVYHGIDGGPSPIDIWDYKFSWNKKRLREASAEDLQKMHDELSLRNKIMTDLFEKYSGMSIVEFLTQFKQ